MTPAKPAQTIDWEGFTSPVRTHAVGIDGVASSTIIVDIVEDMDAGGLPVADHMIP